MSFRKDQKSGAEGGMQCLDLGLCGLWFREALPTLCLCKPRVFPFKKARTSIDVLDVMFLFAGF